MSTILKCNIVVNDLPSEANLLQSLDPVLWDIVRWCFLTLLISIVCWSHIAAPLSQFRIVQITSWNIEVSKFLFELKEFIVHSSKLLTAHDFLASSPYINLPHFRQTLALTFLFLADANWVEDGAIDWRCSTSCFDPLSCNASSVIEASCSSLRHLIHLCLPSHIHWLLCPLIPFATCSHNQVIPLSSDGKLYAPIKKLLIDGGKNSQEGRTTTAIIHSQYFQPIDLSSSLSCWWS